MFTITRLDTTPPESIDSQIKQMVIDYVTDISRVGIAADNPLYPLYQYGVGLEVHQYLQAMDGSRGFPVELIVALDDDPSVVAGFLLYLPVRNDPRACSVAYMAVPVGKRRQGIARAMMDKMLERYPHAELTCFVAKVAYFEAMGFQVLGTRGPHVLMNTRPRPTDGLIAVLDIAPIYASLEVRQIHAYLLKQHGDRAMIDAEKQRDRLLDQMTRQAQLFVQEKLGESGLPRALLH